MSIRSALLFGILLSIFFDGFQIYLSRDNKFLVCIGFLCIGIAVFGLIVNLPEQEDLKLKWIMMYVIPGGLLAIGLLLGKNEIENDILSDFGYRPIPSIAPGASEDYKNSAHAMLYSFTIPMQTVLVNTLYKGVVVAYRALSKWLA